MISQNFKIIPIFNRSVPYIYNNTLYTLYNDTLYSTNLESFVVSAICTDTITNFYLYNNTIVYYNTDIFLYNISTSVVEKYSTLKNAGIKDVIKLNNDLIIFYDNCEIYKNNEIIFSGECKSYVMDDTFLYVSDSNSVTKVDINTYSKTLVFNGKDIIDVKIIDKNLYIFTKNALFYPGGMLNIDVDTVQVTTSHIYIQYKGETYKYNKDLQLVEKYNYLIYASGDLLYDEMFNISVNGKNLVGNFDDILDVQEINNMIVFTSSNKLIYCLLNEINTKELINESTGENSVHVELLYACIGTQIIHHTDTILSISYDKNLLITTSRDQTCAVYYITTDIKYIKNFRTGVMNTSYLIDNTCVLGGEDGLLCYISDVDSESIIFKKICDKDINSVCVNKGLIFVGCADKTCKILDFNLNAVKNIADHKKNVMSVHASSTYFCTASADKTIRVYKYNYECISVLSGHDTGILSVKLFNKDKKLISSAVGGLIKIWDAKKGVCTDNIIVSSDIWSIDVKAEIDDLSTLDLNNLLMGVGNNVVSYKYYKDRTKKNNTVHIKNREFHKVITNNINLIYFLLKESSDKSLLFDKYKNKLLDVIVECGRFKDVEFILKIIDFCVSKKIFNKEIITVLRKYLHLSDELYTDLIAAEIYFK